MNEEEKLLQEQREARRKRRQRNQLLAYLTMFILVAVLALGIYEAVTVFFKDTNTNANMESESSEEFFSSEESLPQPTESTVSIVEELTYEQKLDQIIQATLENMPLEDKVAGLFIVTPEAITMGNTVVEASESLKNALNTYAVGGLYFKEQNMRDENQLKQLITDASNYSRYSLFTAVQEEGGKNGDLVKSGIIAQRERSENTIGKSGDTENAYVAGQNIGSKLSELGINLDFAPSADLANVPNSAVEYNSYGVDAATVFPFAQRMLQGLTEQSVTACVTHFPGNGATTQDTQEGIAVTQRTAGEMRTDEMAVFQDLIAEGVKMVMVGHISVPSLTGDNIPCSLSAEVVTNILRNEFGFDGVIISDSLSKKAISDYYDSADASILALKAGCDMLLMPEDFAASYQAVLDAVGNGTISEERINDALKRIYRIKYADRVE